MLKNRDCYTVYKHTSPSGKIYIGITSQEPERRWQDGNGYAANAHFTKAINKYGWDNFVHEIISTNMSKADACRMEIELIAQHQSNNSKFGYNKSSGGEGSHDIVFTKEGLQRLREARLGTHLSEETKLKMSKKLAGRKLTEEHKKKISESLKGKTHTGHMISDVTKEKIRVASLGKKKPHKGVPRSEETRKKLSIAKKGKNDHCFKRSVMCVETGIIYNSITEAAKANNVDQGNISRSLTNHNRKTAGLSWKYCDDKHRRKRNSDDKP